MPEDNIYFNTMSKGSSKETTPGIDVSVKMSSGDQEKGNGLQSQSSQHANGCQLTVDEVGLLKLKLTILAVLCVILGTFVVAFEVQYFLTVEKCADIAQNLDMMHQQYNDTTAMTKTLEANLTETNKRFAQQTAINIHLSEENTKLKAEIRVLQQAQLCTDGWEYFRGSFYYFASDNTNWDEGRTACVAMGGDLVIIESAEEMDFLRLQLRILKKNEYFIGLTDGQVEGSWWWMDNTTLIDPKFWGQNQPDNYGGVEDCDIILYYVWNDIPCDRVYKRICERKLSCTNGSMDSEYSAGRMDY
ncbi:CD209 antigen-like protein C [Alosa pseudoharengus]|uniref:CD209 antigen-like protein C n=1 Tax=Alosa pseudoharengus TaxID=34774 RepID=UPI003F89B3AF